MTNQTPYFLKEFSTDPFMVPVGWDSQLNDFHPDYFGVENFSINEIIKDRLFQGDNLVVMDRLLSKGKQETIDFIYIDPPYFDVRHLEKLWLGKIFSRKDGWPGAMQIYLGWLNARLWRMGQLLKPAGMICVHLDWHAVHYVKVEMDKIFGPGGDKSRPGFRNEIVWCYRQGGRTNHSFPHKHDVLLVYSKSAEWKFFPDRVRVPYDGTGGYQTSGKGVTHKSGKTYTPNPDGKIPEDWWDIPALPPMSRERLGYPTQKPLALLERLVKVYSDEGDLVADFFCGSGVTLAAAKKLNRNWLGSDLADAAIDCTTKRLANLEG